MKYQEVMNGISAKTDGNYLYVRIDENRIYRMTYSSNYDNEYIINDIERCIETGSLIMNIENN